MEEKSEWRLRIASSLGGGFAGSAFDVWGLGEYNPSIDKEKSLISFGCYGVRDLQAVIPHKGKKAILWCGSDIRHALNGYWLDGKGESKLDPIRVGAWLGQTCDHYVENELEKIALASIGITATVIPSFLGNVDDYPVQKLDSKPRFYTSVSGDDFELYGWDEIPGLAQRYPHIEFHLYGNKTLPPKPVDRFALQELNNIIIHGRVAQEQMDAETKTMTGALRLTRFDGFSEILCKSVLWGQAPVSPYIHYPFIRSSFEDPVPPNAREEMLKVLNKFPFNSNV